MTSKFKITVNNEAIDKIMSFYNNVGIKLPNTNTGDVIEKNIINTINSIYSIKQNILIRNPYLDRWAGYRMITCGKWNFAVDVKDNEIVVVDACHQQNMTNNHSIAEMFENDLNASVQRITDITFPLSRDSRHFIRCKIDGEQQFLHEIPLKYFNQYKSGELTKYQLAEKCYAKELNENRFTLDQFLNKGPKL